MTNDVVATLIMASVLEDRVRAHDYGVVKYSQGAFQLEEIAPDDMHRMEHALLVAAAFLREILAGGAARASTIGILSLARLGI